MLESANHTEFNVAVWTQLLADPVLEALPHRIETDRFGQIIMSPPPAPSHGEKQVDIGATLRRLLPAGRVISECPVSTSDGVKAVDVAWITMERYSGQPVDVCLTVAREICVEIFSQNNSKRELTAKKALYFEAGAEEVWFCHLDGRMEFFLSAAPDRAVRSSLCPEFPLQVVSRG